MCEKMEGAKMPKSEKSWICQDEIQERSSAASLCNQMPLGDEAQCWRILEFQREQLEWLFRGRRQPPSDPSSSVSKFAIITGKPARSPR
jgi:hypothetical protein